MKILVIGASGPTGKEIVKQAIEQGHVSMQTRAEADSLSTKEALAATARLYLVGNDPLDPLASPFQRYFSGATEYSTETRPAT